MTSEERLTGSGEIQLRGVSGMLKSVGFVVLGLVSLADIVSRLAPSFPVRPVEVVAAVVLGIGIGTAMARDGQAAGGDSRGTEP